jgi:hypothetical protein
MGLNGNILSHNTFPKWFPNNHATNSGWCMQKSARFCPPHKSLIHKACLLSLHGVSQWQSIFAQQFETRSLHRVEYVFFLKVGAKWFTRSIPSINLADIQQRGHGQQPATMVQDMGFQRTTPEAPTGCSRHVWSSGQTRIGFSTGFRMQ